MGSLARMATPATLGLTCKDALMIFSQNETLQLQKRVQELEERLAKYEPINNPIRVFDTQDDWFELNDEIQVMIRNFLTENVTTCDANILYDSGDKLAEVCDVSKITNMVSSAFEVITGDKKLSDNLAQPYAKFMHTVIDVAHFAFEYVQVHVHFSARKDCIEDFIFFATLDYIDMMLFQRKIIVVPCWKEDY